MKNGKIEDCINKIRDIKEATKLDKNKVEKSKILNYINSITKEKTDWMEILKFNSKEENYIKNWLRYRISAALNLYTVKEFDGDTTKEAINFCKRMLKEGIEASQYSILDSAEYIRFKEKERTEEKENIKTRNIYLINKHTNEKIVLETDTMNSVQTTFGYFMRRFMKRIIEDDSHSNNWVKETYDKKYKLSEEGCKRTSKELQVFRDIYFLNNIEYWYNNKMNEEETNCLKAFNRLAKLTHSMANFTIVPLGYNSKRNSKVKDYWDLTLLDLQSMKVKESFPDKNYEWYINHIDLFKINDWFENGESLFKEAQIEFLWDNHKIKDLAKDNNLILKCVENINERIIGRDIQVKGIYQE